MADLLKIIGTVFSTASILTGLIFLKKANESIDYLIGASLIVLGILIGTVFFFFANMLLNSEKQTTLLREIKEHLSFNDSKRTVEKNLLEKTTSD